MCVYCEPATAPPPSNNGSDLALKGGTEDDILNVEPGPRELYCFPFFFNFEINEVLSVFLEWKAVVKEKLRLTLDVDLLENDLS